MGGDGHDGSGSVAHQHIVRDPDGNLFSIDRIDGIGSGEDPCFFLGEVRAFQVAFGGALGAVLFHSMFLFRRGDGIYQRVLRGKNHVGGSEEGVRPGGVNSNRFSVQGEVHFRTFRFAYPVALKQFNGFRPVQGLQLVNEAFRVVRDAQHPLAQGAAFHAVSLGFPFLHFLIGKDGSQVRGPVDGSFRYVGQPALVDFFPAQSLFLQFGNGARLFQFLVVVGVVKLEEYPLGPTDVFMVRCCYFPVPVVREPQHFELAAEVVYIPEGSDGGVLSGFNGVLFRRKAEGVPPHGMEHVEAVHAFETRYNVRGGVPFRMAHRQARPAGVGEHVQHVVFGFGRIKALFSGVVYFKGFPLVPDLLPFRFKNVKGIWFLALGHDGRECILRPRVNQA